MEDSSKEIMEDNKTTLEMVNGLAEIADFMADEELTQALVLVAKLIMNPDLAVSNAPNAIVKLQAIGVKMSLRATWMVNVEKGDRAKKNIYFTAAEGIDKLVSALKYLVRN